MVSRSHPELVRRLFEREVPELVSGAVSIMAIAREAGARTKIAVRANTEGVNPKGALIGPGGARVRAVMENLGPEKIDIVDWSADPAKFVAAALSPAVATGVQVISEKNQTAIAFIHDDQLSLAIGKGGLNIRLSKMLTGYDIDVYREVEEEDVALTEFADEIDGWVIDALKACGCDTAKSVLELPVEEIAARADLELEQAQKVVEILKAEFEE